MEVWGLRPRRGICPVYVCDGQDRCKLNVAKLQVGGPVVNRAVFLLARAQQCAIWSFRLQRFCPVSLEMALAGYDVEADAFRESRNALAIFLHRNAARWRSMEVRSSNIAAGLSAQIDSCTCDQTP